MKYPRVPDARAVLSPRTAQERALLFEAGLQEMERHRDELIAACAVLRRLMENEQKIADMEFQPPSTTDTCVSPPPQKEEQ